MRLFSYKLTDDCGFAPNPFWGILTLATCKPQIRRYKKEGDWIAGFTSGTLCGHAVGRERLIYLMQVKHKVPIAQYFRDPKYAQKIPNQKSRCAVERAGDNIYRPRRGPASAPSDFVQLPNDHHCDMKGGCRLGDTQRHDLSGLNVLIAVRFAYFGRDAIEIPASYRPEVPAGQSAHGVLAADTARAQAFVDYVFAKAGRKRIHAAPHQWAEGDESWREA
jgi:hypothetical protein